MTKLLSVALTLLAPLATPASVAAQSPLHPLINLGDGIARASAVTQNSTEAPDEKRFWVGQGVRRAQIQIDNRERNFSEELVGQDYSSEIIDLEFDELSPVTDDHRLFVLTAYQQRTGVPGKLQYLNVSSPGAPFEVALVELTDPSTTPRPYDIVSICVVPEEQLLLAGGTLKSISPLTKDEPILMLFRYGQPSPTEPDQLVKIAEARPGLVPLPCGGGSFHNVRGVLGVFAHRVADDLLAFPTIAVDGHNNPMPRGVGLVRIDADAPLEADRLVWMTDPQHAIDPAGAEYLQLCTGSANPPSNDAISVRWLDFVDTVNAEEEPQTLLYLACGSAWQVREYDITNVVGSGGFVPGAVIEIPFNPGIANGSDNLYWIAARHEPAQNVDLLYVAGRHHMYCVHRTLHSYQQTNHWLRNGEDMEGHVVVEQTLTTNGDREHVWTVAAETSHPWTIFDMTDRFHNPALEAPDVLEKRFAPGGCDGGVAVPELDSVYFGYFAGIARLDVGTMFDDGGAVPPAITPVYDSYQPAIVPAQGEQIIEQIDLIRFPGTTDPFRLFTPNGAGDILEWKIDTALPAFTKNPLPPTLIELDWDVSWPEAYANCATAGWSEHAQRPYCSWITSRQACRRRFAWDATGRGTVDRTPSGKCSM